MGFYDSAFKAQVEDSTGLALRGLAAILATDDHAEKPQAKDGRGNLIDYHVRRQRRVVRSTFSAELNGLIDSIGSMLLLQTNLHQIYCGTKETPQQLIDLMECGALYPPIDMCIDAKAVFDAISAADVTDPNESSLKLHLISIRDRLAVGIIRSLFWTDTRDMVADALTKGGVDRHLIEAICERCEPSSVMQSVCFMF